MEFLKVNHEYFFAQIHVELSFFRRLNSSLSLRNRSVGNGINIYVATVTVANGTL